MPVQACTGGELAYTYASIRNSSILNNSLPNPCRWTSSGFMLDWQLRADEILRIFKRLTLTQKEGLYIRVYELISKDNI